MPDQRPPGDEPVTNVPDPEDDRVFDDVSTGAEAEEAAVADGGFEKVEGFRPPSLLAPESAQVVDPGTVQLRDVGEASFGPAPVLPMRPETVQGIDNRIQVKDTTRYPWRVHAALRVTAADDSQWIGTGWFVGPRLLVTAGHVVYIKNSGVPGRDGWVKSITAVPGRDGAEQPFGQTVSGRFFSVRGWTDSGDEEYDYGAIALDEPLGDRTGWFGFATYNNLDGVVGNISGYPGDKPAGTQWYDARVIHSVKERKVFYETDTAGGQSGAAVYRIQDGRRIGFGIHAYGGTVTNSATRINRFVFDNLTDWKAASENGA
jgi:glutamyl endopeptidase